MNDGEIMGPEGDARNVSAAPACCRTGILRLKGEPGRAF